MHYQILSTQSITADDPAVQIALPVVLPNNARIAYTFAPEAQATERWAIPQQIVDGRWVIPSPDDTGVEPEPDWWLAVLI
jgi:hypothetical protein